jgi:hypothetical protein
LQALSQLSTIDHSTLIASENIAENLRGISQIAAYTAEVYASARPL